MKIDIQPTKDLSPMALVAGAGFLCIVYPIPPLHKLWSTAYPLDPMTEDDAAVITMEGVTSIEGMQLYSPDDVTLILDGLEKVGLRPLSDIIRQKLVRSRL